MVNFHLQEYDIRNSYFGVIVKILFFLLLLSACARNSIKRETSLEFSDAPEAVQTAFHARHPDIKSNFHKQTIDGMDSYEIHIESSDMDRSERYSSDGHLIETEEEIKLTDIPEPIRIEIQSYLRENDSSKIQKIQKVNSAELDGYEIRSKTKESSTGLMEYFFERNGKIHHAEEVELLSIHNLN